MDESSSVVSRCCRRADDSLAGKPCCGPTPAGLSGVPRRANAFWVEGTVKTPVGEVPRVGSALRFRDRLGEWRVRWGIGRMRYRVDPGLYAVGDPTAESPVFVSANFKMSFDRLRSQLGGRDGWILVLDTRGINVWCAAGKGTFGTEEIVRRVTATGLGNVVSHRTLVLPQLGAPGVSAHEVRRQCDFRVVYGPVRSEDLPAFLDAGMKATPEMRRVRFPLRSRIVLVPIEIVSWGKYALPVAAGLLLLSGLGSGGYSTERAVSVGAWSAGLLLVACLGAAVLTPALLPWLPGRSFSAKGAWIGVGLVLAVLAYTGFEPRAFDGLLGALAWLFMIPAVASFIAMNFTGASTYTSLSGVRREMRVAVPLQVGAAAVGLALWIAGRFVPV